MTSDRLATVHVEQDVCVIALFVALEAHAGHAQRVGVLLGAVEGGVAGLRCASHRHRLQLDILYVHLLLISAFTVLAVFQRNFAIKRRFSLVILLCQGLAFWAQILLCGLLLFSEFEGCFLSGVFC